MIRRVSAALLLLLLVVGCTAPPGPDRPAQDQQQAQAALTALARGLHERDVHAVAFDSVTGEQAQQVLASITAQIPEAVRPQVMALAVAPGDPSTGGESTGEADGQLDWVWSIPGVAQEWTYTTTVRLIHRDGTWRPAWSPTVVHPQLAADQHFSLDRTAAERGMVTGQRGEPLTSVGQVIRVGIEKGVAKERAEASARALATVVGIDAEAYVARVRTAGPLQFVEAITYRQDDPDKPYASEVGRIPGAKLLGGTAVLALTRTFARPVLGTVGAATAEIIAESKGAVQAGDQVGLSGLQSRYDTQLRGQTGLRISLVADKAEAPAPSSASPGASASPAEPTVLFDAEPVAGDGLATSLDPTLQLRAEDAVASVRSAAAVVVIRPSDGSVLAMANGPANPTEIAALGRYAPGSTFKVVTALALLRAGMKPDDVVECPETVVVDGRTFKNYPGYPRSRTGSITLAQALANSCNTAFIGLRDRVTADDLRAAGGSLGLGVDYDVGYPAYFGEVPDEETETGHAAAMIGQGTVLASPMAMAAVAASVTVGHTVVPVLVDQYAPSATADPLTAQEASDLRAMMRLTVTEGSARFLQRYGSLGAKTGTAEYGTQNPPRTHAWLLAQGGDLAMAVFVADGDSGSATAGPIAESVLSSR